MLGTWEKSNLYMYRTIIGFHSFWMIVPPKWSEIHGESRYATPMVCNEHGKMSNLHMGITIIGIHPFWMIVPPKWSEIHGDSRYATPMVWNEHGEISNLYIGIPIVRFHPFWMIVPATWSEFHGDEGLRISSKWIRNLGFPESHFLFVQFLNLPMHRIHRDRLSIGTDYP